uniref:WGS project CBME000000000 data, contig CS3487_c000719 n=1 Tax=Fusarium pseudograminearum CS3487 TaxID=1318458 RepID=A0A096PDH3_FUSPS|nr:unnamed protein product [Fusarium pseudograminearum CS3487]
MQATTSTRIVNTIDTINTRFKILDSAQFEEPEYDHYDMVISSSAAFVSADFRDTLVLDYKTYLYDI